MVSAKLTPLFFATTEKIEESSYFLNITKYAVKHALRKIMVELKCKVNEVVKKKRSQKAGSVNLISEAIGDGNVKNGVKFYFAIGSNCLVQKLH